MSIVGQACSNWLKSQNSSVMGLEELTLVTEAKEYEPGYSNPETIAANDYEKELEQLRIDFREGAISEENYKKAVKEVLERKHAETIAAGNPEELIRYFTTRDEAESELGPIDWYIGDKPPYRYGPEDKCFYCGGPTFMFKVTKLTDGKLIGYPLCRVHTGGEVTSEHSSNPGEPIGSNFHTLMLHAVAEMYGPGGIIVDEAKARATPCSCVEYKPDKFWCTSKGVVGALTDEQEMIYCNPREIVERPGVKERMTKWAEAVEFCRAQLPPTDGRTRLEVYLDCMSKQLTKAGIEV